MHVNKDHIYWIRKSGEFDEPWYLARYPDVQALGMDPVEHYLWIGAKLGRDPSPNFSSEGYLTRNPDVAKAGINPFLHYCLWGKQEGRNSVASDETIAYRSKALPFTSSRPNVIVVAHVVAKNVFGSERSFLDILDGFRANNFNVIAVLPADVDAYTSEVSRRSSNVVIMNYGWWRDRHQPNTEAIERFKSVFIRHRPNAVHVNTIMLREPLIAARSLGIASVCHVRELIHQDEWLTKTIGESPSDIQKSVEANSDWIIANSKATANAFLGHPSTLVVENTCDTDALDMSNPITGKMRFGIISSNIIKKGILDFLEVARICEKQAHSAEFLIIGPESELIKEIFQREVYGKVPENLKFAGYAESPVDAVASVNVVLSLSHFAESFGRTVLEAMAARRPVIAYHRGAVPELIKNGETGFLVPFKDTDAVASAAMRLCREPNLLRSMGEAARDVAIAKYAPQQYAHKLGAAYNRILNIQDSRSTLEILKPRPEGKLRIAYFCWHFPVPSETFVLNELRYLVTCGHDVIVFCRQSPYKDFHPDFFIRWERVASPEELAEKLKATKRNIAHGHFVFPTVTEFLWPACEEAGIPFTFIAHAQDIFKYENDQKNRLAEIVRSPLCLRLFVLSDFHRDYVLDRGVPAQKVTINPNAIDVSLFEGGSIPDRAARQFRSVCAVHRFCEKKGLEHLIRAGKELEKEGIQIDLYGYGPLEEEYRSIITELKLENVRICGRIENREELLNVFRRYDLFACPSVRAADGDMDGIPTSVAEAMAAGLPVLTTSLSGIPDLVTDGVTGIICEANPTDIAEGIRRYFQMPPEQVECIIETAKRIVTKKHDVHRLVRVLERVWRQQTIDLIIVSWTHLDEHREVIERLFKYTSLPFNVIVSVNSDNQDVLTLLNGYRVENPNFKLIINGYNAYVGPGTNKALEAGGSDIAIYVCGREGFALRPGWELEFVHYMAENPEVGLAGSLCYAPAYLTGKQYEKNIRLFPKFRNQGFATANPDREFQHVQGGLFAIRRKMYDEIGGFSEAIPHDYTDTEYSFYAESCGWKLGQVSGISSIFNKTQPPLLSRLDDSIRAAHPPKLTDLPLVDRIVRGSVRVCNVCEWTGDRFASTEVEGRSCPNCGSTPADRTLYKWLTESKYMFRRLPAISVGLAGPMQLAWHQQFQGPQLSVDDFLHQIDETGALANRTGALKIAAIRISDCDFASEVPWNEFRRLLSIGAPLVVQSLMSGEEREKLMGSIVKAGFHRNGEFRPASRTSEFDWHAMSVFNAI